LVGGAEMYFRLVGGAKGAFPIGRRSRRCISDLSEGTEVHSPGVSDRRHCSLAPPTIRKCPLAPPTIRQCPLDPPTNRKYPLAPPTNREYPLALSYSRKISQAPPASKRAPPIRHQLKGSFSMPKSPQVSITPAVSTCPSIMAVVAGATPTLGMLLATV